MDRVRVFLHMLGEAFRQRAKGNHNAVHVLIQYTESKEVRPPQSVHTERVSQAKA